jgi:sugar phosphate isomerase/epimerase
MNRCFSTLGCAEMGLDEVLALTRRHGLGAVELRALGGTVDLPAQLMGAFGSPAGLKARLHAEPVRIVALDTSLKLAGSTDADWQKTVEAFLPWAEALDGLNLRVFDGGHEGGEADIAVMAERLDWWQSLRHARGWRSDLMIETHDSLFTAATIQTLLTAAPTARILWDSHHTWKRGGEDPLVTWRAIAPAVVHVHVKDSISVPSARHPYTYVRPGEGEFPAGPLLQALAAECKGAVSLEWERMWHPYLPPLEDALRAAARRGWW